MPLGLQQIARHLEVVAGQLRQIVLRHLIIIANVGDGEAR